jgi:hypothetical protein
MVVVEPVVVARRGILEVAVVEDLAMEPVVIQFLDREIVAATAGSEARVGAVAVHPQRVLLERVMGLEVMEVLGHQIRSLVQVSLTRAVAAVGKLHPEIHRAVAAAAAQEEHRQGSMEPSISAAAAAAHGKMLLPAKVEEVLSY